jgi:RecB family endonuclease NucS
LAGRLVAGNTDGRVAEYCPKRQYGPATMRLLVARCEVLYTGRLTARLPEAVRLLLFKADGSFSSTTMQAVIAR